MRRVRRMPSVNYFMPVTDGKTNPGEILITVDEYESLRLKDLMGLEQTEAAIMMGISQATFNRLLTSARKKVSEAIINGKALRIEGGNFKTFDQFIGHRHGHRGMESAMASEGGDVCICNECGYSFENKRDKECNSLKCPVCGHQMEKLKKI
ncbi:MAG: DUF134 domain-containing protein [Thermoplasmata archaeon]